MKVFMTGATGGVGPAVVRELLRKNFTVACLARDPGKISDKILAENLESRLSIIQGDLMEIAAIESQLRDYRPEVIVHLGWMGVDQKEKSNPGQIHNLQAAVDLLRIGKSCGVKTFIGMGSESEYGVHNKKIDETAANMPISKYAIAKFATGLMCEKICRDFSIDFVWLRLFSSYGPNDRAGSLMSQMIRTLLAGKPMSLSKCEQVWDYVYVDDIARLIALIAGDAKESGFFNLGGGDARVLKEIVYKIAEQINPQAELRFGDIAYGPNHNMHLEADITKLKTVYGWKPEISLDEGLARTIAWHRQQI